MEKEFVPYGLAVKLKELGFDEPCIAGYRDYNGIKLMTRVKDNTYPLVNNSGFGKYCHQNKHIVKAPLWQQAFDWFEVSHRLYSCFDNIIFSFGITDCRNNDIKVEKYITHGDNYKTKIEVKKSCLEKLIELIQNKNDRSI